MRITAAVAEQLLLLHGDPDRGRRLRGRAGPARSRRRPRGAVLPRRDDHARRGSGDEISVSTTAAAPAAVLASLAVPLSAGSSGGLLILRAGEAGAFLLLADDLDGLLGPGHPPIELDEHLAWPAAANAESLGASLADLSVVDQAIGVLVDRGLPPEAAHRELWRRVGEADTTVAAVSRAVAGVPAVGSGPQLTGSGRGAQAEVAGLSASSGPGRRAGRALGSRIARCRTPQ